MYSVIIRVLTVCVLCLLPWVQSITAQKHSNVREEPKKYAPVLTGAPILSITPDARASAMGDIGVVGKGSAFALFHNLSLLTEVDNTWGISIGYTPWMPDISTEMSLSAIYGYYRWNSSEGLRYAVAGSLRYFNIGETMAFRKTNSNDPIQIHPYEFVANAGFAIGFGPHWSIAQTLGYLHSDYNFSHNGKDGFARTLLVDISANYRSPNIVFDVDTEGVITLGLAVNNIGGTISHDNNATKQFLPTLLRLGEGIDLNFAQDSQELSIYLEQSKLLAPTMPIIFEERGSGEIARKRYQNETALSALFTSWCDAPGGFAEEIKEIMLAIGAEYRYHGSLDLALRIGYKHQHEDKGSGAGITLGAGLIYQKAKLDLSYFIANKSKSPLNNTLRISLGIDF